MKIIKTFLLILTTLSIIYFLQLNDAKVNVDLIFYKFPDASVSMIIFGSLATGLLIGYLIAIFSILASKSEIRKLQNKNKGLAEELNNLRNVAIDEGIYDTDDGSF
tara:strand:- start:844 stop:1161 length:318 start_codon:yes stop_codon:yes gene_type:complete